MANLKVESPSRGKYQDLYDGLYPDAAAAGETQAAKNRYQNIYNDLYPDDVGAPNRPVDTEPRNRELELPEPEVDEININPSILRPSVDRKLQPPNEAAKAKQVAKERKLPDGQVYQNWQTIKEITDRQARESTLNSNEIVRNTFLKDVNTAGIIQNDLPKLVAHLDNPLYKFGATRFQADGQTWNFTKAPTRADFPVGKHGFVRANQLYKEATDSWLNRQREVANLVDPNAAQLSSLGPQSGLEVIFDTFRAGMDYQDAVQGGFFGNLQDEAARASGLVDPDIAKAVSVSRAIDKINNRNQPQWLRDQAEALGNAKPESLAELVGVLKDNFGAVLNVTAFSFGQQAETLPAVFLSAAGGPAVLAAVSGLSSFNVAYWSTIYEVAQRNNINITSAEDLYGFYTNEELMAEARSKAGQYAGTVAAFDALSAGITGKLATLNQFSPASRAGAGAVIQATGGGAGEATASYTTFGEINPVEVAIEALVELPTGAIETIISIETGRERIARQQAVKDAKAGKAEQNAIDLNRANAELSDMDAMNVESPAGRETVENVLNQANPDLDVTIDGDVYNRIMQQMAERGEFILEPPAVDDQRSFVQDSGGEYVIPGSQFFAAFANTPSWEQLVEYVRLEPDGMSLADARDYAETKDAELQADLERFANIDEATQRVANERTNIKNDVKKQLSQADRFTSETNDAYAEMWAAYYETMGARVGVMPGELYESTNPTITSEPPFIVEKFDQNILENVEWFAGSVAADANAEPLLLNTTGVSAELGRFEPSQMAESAAQFANDYVVSIKQPVEVEAKSIDNAEKLTDDLVGQGVLTADDVTQLKESSDTNEMFESKVRAELKERGFDGLVYKTESGDNGYVPFDASQVREVTRAVPFANAFEQRAFHGSRHKFDEFSLKAVGTGAGAQGHGYGLYFASKKSFAEFYRDQGAAPTDYYLDLEGTDYGLSGPLSELYDSFMKRELFAEYDVLEAIGLGNTLEEIKQQFQGTEAEAFANLLNRENVSPFDSERGRLSWDEEGFLYEVEIPDTNEFANTYESLDFQDPIQDKIDNVLDSLPEAFWEHVNEERQDYVEGYTFIAFRNDLETFYGIDLSESAATQKAAKLLSDAGIKGSVVKERDGTDVFVVWDESVIGPAVTYEQRLQAQEYFQFAGEGSETAIVDNMVEAMRLQDAGFDKQTVYRRTGWFRGIDDAWRYEISDDKAGYTSEILDRIEQAKRRIEADEGKFEEGTLPAGNEIFVANEAVPLPDLMQHDELYEAYPFLNNIIVRFEPLRPGQHGYASWTHGKIAVNINNPLDSKDGFSAFSTILHEAQHMIQHYESDRAIGGTTQQKYLRQVIQALRSERDRARRVGESAKLEAIFQGRAEQEVRDELQQYHLVEQVQTARRYMQNPQPSRIKRHIANLVQTLYDPSNTLWNQSWDDSRYVRARELIEDWRSLPKRNPELSSALTTWLENYADFLFEQIPADKRVEVDGKPNNLKKLIDEAAEDYRVLRMTRINAELDVQTAKDFEGLIKYLKTASPHEVYELIYGEVEARNVQARRNMTPDERRRSYPESTEDPTNPQFRIVLNTGGISLPVNMYNEQAPQKRVVRGSYAPSSRTISLLKDANYSTFIHESGHHFLETTVEVVGQLMNNENLSETQAGVVNDLSTTFKTLGIEGPIEEQMTQYASMDFAERRSYHEKFAAAFEQYMLEGKAPSLEMANVFKRLRQFMIQVYKSIKNFLANNPDAGSLNDELREVFDRMMATDEQIRVAREANSMLPIFQSPEEAGMTVAEFKQYLAQDEQARLDAVEDLEGKTIRDVRWLSNAKSKAIRRLQKEARGLRREMRIEARRELFSKPVYRAFQFLTNRIGKDDKIEPLNDPARSRQGPVEPRIDSLFVAMAKLGGINREQTQSTWGIDPKQASPRFGTQPVVRKTGGLSLDDMGERLAELGYLEVDRDGKYDPIEFEEKFDLSWNGGEDQYSNYVDVAAIRLEPQAGDQVVNPDALNAGRFDRLALMDIVGEGVTEKFIAMGMVANNGLHPQQVAEKFGYDSVGRMLRELVDAEPPKPALDGLTDRKMLEKHGEYADPKAIEAAAERSIANDARARFVTTELNLLGKSLGKQKITRQAAKLHASRTLDKTTLRNIVPIRWKRAAVRAASATLTALRKGDSAAAYGQKRTELLNTELANQGYKIKEQQEKDVKYLRKFTAPGAIKTLNLEYHENILDVLRRFNLAAPSRKQADKDASFSAFVADALKSGVVPDLPYELFLTREQAVKYQNALVQNPDMDEAAQATMLAGMVSESRQININDMTWGEWQMLIQTVKQMEHLGRLKNKLLLEKEKKTLREKIDELKASINANALDRSALNRAPRNTSEEFVEAAKTYGGLHLRVGALAYVMDGGKYGTFWNTIVRKANEQSAWEVKERSKATKKLTKIIKPLLKRAKRFGGLRGKPEYYESVDMSFTREEIYALAWNFGNSSNRSRLNTNNNLSDEQLGKLFKEAMSAEEWGSIQELWDFVGSYKDEIGQQVRRVEGREPEWIEVEAFTIDTSDGQTVTLKGGYMPVAYDPAASVRASDQDAVEQARQQLSAASNHATTRRTFTKSRFDGEIKGRPLLLSFDVLTRHVNDVIHDLAWREYLIDFNRLMGDELRGTIRQRYGKQADQILTKWAEDIGLGYVQGTPGDQIAGVLRRGVSAAGLGINLISAAMQIAGFLPALNRVGAGKMLWSFGKYWMNPARATRNVKELSTFMEMRPQTRLREIREIKNVVSGEGRTSRALRASTFYIMLQVQQIVDVVTWQAAYEQEMQANADHERSIAVADQVVKDTQGGGEIVDLSTLERGGKWAQLFTVFYNYMGTILNLNYTTAKGRKSAGRKMFEFTNTMVLSYIAGELVRNAVTPGEAEEWDWEDPEFVAKEITGGLINNAIGQFVGLRELGPIIERTISDKPGQVTYQGPAGTRPISEIARLFGTVESDSKEAIDVFWQMINVIGTFMGLPVAQINRMKKGYEAYIENETDNPAALLMGYEGD